MESNLILGLSIGGPVILTSIAGFVGITFQVGRWNGKVTKTLEVLTDTVHEIKEDVGTCHERVDTHLEGHPV